MLLSVHITPKAKKVGVHRTNSAGVLRVGVHAAPENGRANEELCELLAEHFHVPKTAVRIVRGFTSRRKVVEIPRRSA
jgi:uncharacterized protein (TIGR00251 family)